MPRPGRAHRTAFVLAAAFFSLSALAPATILCVGSGGHFALEAALAHCCDPAHSPGDRGLSLVQSERCADRCTDTPLGLQTVCRNPEDKSAPPHPLVLAAPFLFAEPPAAVRHRTQPLGRALLALPPPRALRTTVIVC